MRQNAARWVPLFPEEEISFILAAVVRSGARLRKLHDTELENDLTDRLRGLLDRDPGLRARPIELFREVPIYDRRRARQKQLGRTDLMFLYSTGIEKPWPYFVIESKRLHVTFPSGRKSLVPDYVTGHQGMMCFIEERYSCDLDSAGMLGYVFDGDIERARASVAASIEANHGQLQWSPTPRLVPSSVLPDGSRVSESSHSLSRRAFKIYHLFLAV